MSADRIEGAIKNSPPFAHAFTAVVLLLCLEAAGAAVVETKASLTPAQAANATHTQLVLMLERVMGNCQIFV